MKMTNSNKFDTHESFYHGLVKSKLWLCEELEVAMYRECFNKPSLHILGCWDNLLAFMLLTRKPEYYNIVHGYDINPEAIANANKICGTWQIEEPKVINHLIDVNRYDYSNCINETIFINCSIDQMDSNKWYDSIPVNSLVCIQAVDVTNPEFPWLIRQTTSSLDELINRFSFSTLLYSGIKRIQYPVNSYKRFMIIGRK